MKSTPARKVNATGAPRRGESLISGVARDSAAGILVLVGIVLLVLVRLVLVPRAGTAAG